MFGMAIPNASTTSSIGNTNPRFLAISQTPQATHQHRCRRQLNQLRATQASTQQTLVEPGAKT